MCIRIFLYHYFFAVTQKILSWNTLSRTNWPDLSKGARNSCFTQQKQNWCRKNAILLSKNEHLKGTTAEWLFTTAHLMKKFNPSWKLPELTSIWPVPWNYGFRGSKLVFFLRKVRVLLCLFLSSVFLHNQVLWKGAMETVLQMLPEWSLKSGWQGLQWTRESFCFH